jgi:hypothetical protein
MLLVQIDAYQDHVVITHSDDGVTVVLANLNMLVPQLARIVEFQFVHT